MQSVDDFGIFEVSTEGFEQKALKVFAFQYRENAIYRQYCDLMQKTPQAVKSITQIPFLPIGFFKSNKIISGDTGEAQAIFESSGTTAQQRSMHYVMYTEMYERSFLKAFAFQYGNPKDWCILALLPSYLERQNASLVYMADALIKASNNKNSGFYLYDVEALNKVLKQNEAAKIKTLLLGVSFALLDFAEKFPMPLKHTTIIETGGMKGRREELLKEELHTVLSHAFGLNAIHSEYGMTELLSQAYSSGNGIFTCPPWMKILLRAEDDPMFVQCADEVQNKPKTGVINIIDLANIYSCSFIATDDVGRLYKDGRLEILGRIDYSDIRGCSQMVV